MNNSDTTATPSYFEVNYEEKRPGFQPSVMPAPASKTGEGGSAGSPSPNIAADPEPGSSEPTGKMLHQ